VGSGTDEFEELTDILNRMSVYRTALLGDENAEGTKVTVEINVEWLDRRNILVVVTQNGKKTSEIILNSSRCERYLSTNSTSKYPYKIFLYCQNANMKIAQFSNDSVDTVRI